MPPSTSSTERATACAFSCSFPALLKLSPPAALLLSLLLPPLLWARLNSVQGPDRARCVFRGGPGAGESKETICTLESVKAVGEAYAPVDCEVIEVNEKLNDEPTLVNSSCMEDGWLVKIKYTGDLSGMMDQAAYDKHLEDTKEE